ncbi:MAG: hypothetical protein KC684_04040 [Candidatus Omnitrophica bacterium]|nr:hypothetical protein [Candidatus Omnitrophota bacterium]
MKNKFTIAILAGLVAFIWSWVSWMALPFHNQMLHKFKNSDAVAAALKMNAPENGIYLLPWCDNLDKKLSKEEQKAAYAEHDKKLKEGPYAYVLVRPNGMEFKMGQSMLIGLLKDILTAFLLVWLISKTTGLSFIQKVAFVKIAVVSGAIVSLLPNWIWWGFPTDLTVLALIDVAIGWGLAGCVIAKLTK